VICHLLTMQERTMHGANADVKALLEAVSRGEIGPEAALAELVHLPVRQLGFARVDTQRELRQGAPEAILAEGKSPAQVAEIFQAMVAAGAGSVLATRADEEARAAVRAVVPDAIEHEQSRTIWVAPSLPPLSGLVTIVSAGTSDGSVAHEARIRAELLGVDVALYEDVGVAGLHRLIEVLPDLERSDCVIVVAGMDAALASVVGGLVACPVIGVPTSVGYGIANQGRTALNAMLTSCAAALAVVGIDDGFGAGTVAARIARGRT
jgi:NCAIR mutase (PurE)-related protein